MKVIEISTPGEPDVLVPAERPTPAPGPGEVLIAVKAAGINRPDLLQRRGMYPPPPGASDLPGLEVAGTIAKCGEGVDLPEGTRVMALLPGGGYAEFATVDARHVLELPDNVTFEEAAGMPETLYTVWANVFEAGDLTPDEVLFVHGATSGIGTMAASLARAFGAKIYGTAGNDEKCRAAEKAGYTKVFNYKDEDWGEGMTRAGGADVVLDMVGGDYVKRNLDLLNPGGRHVSIAFLGGIEAQINIITVMQKRLVLTGSTLRARDGLEKARLTDEIRRQVMPLVKSGQIQPLIDRTFPLHHAADAHRLMEAGNHIGKIVLTL